MMVEHRPLNDIIAYAILTFGVFIVAFPVYLAFVASTHDAAAELHHFRRLADRCATGARARNRIAGPFYPRAVAQRRTTAALPCHLARRRDARRRILDRLERDRFMLDGLVLPLFDGA